MFKDSIVNFFLYLCTRAIVPWAKDKTLYNK